MNWSEFFHMGGYAFYVWGSYLLTFIVIAVEVAALVNCARKSAAQTSVDSKSDRK